jgi:thiamine biosynthesis lipoprotein
MNVSILRRAQPWLGTIVSIDLVVDAGTAQVAHAFARAFAAIERVHASMSVQSSRSDVARFNGSSAGTLVTCDPWTIDVLELAQRLQTASNGLFDPALGTSRAAAYRIVDRRSIVKLEDGCRLDLGGIAKGYAVDRAVVELRACGIRRGLVNAGGDLRAFGSGAWPVLVRNQRDEVRSHLSLERGSMATSQYRLGRSPYRDDELVAPARRAVHAIDGTITVAAPRCVLADALTKVVALSGDVQHPALRAFGGQAWLH